MGILEVLGLMALTVLVTIVILKRRSIMRIFMKAMGLLALFVITMGVIALNSFA